MLEADPDLGRDLDRQLFAAARPHLVARVIELDAGRQWDAPSDVEEHRGHLGLLVLDGLLTRDVVLARTPCAELLGSGDVLRPWEHLQAGGAVPFEVRWDVLAPTRLAVLDRGFAVRAGRIPEVTTALMGRGVRRSHWLGLHLAIRCLRRVDARLLVLFWHLAERWGRVTPEGVVVPLGLTHQLLARLVGAQRPSVTTALGRLCERGAIRRREEDWLLSRHLPRELERIHEGRSTPRGRDGRGIFAAGR